MPDLVLHLKHHMIWTWKKKNRKYELECLKENSSRETRILKQIHS